MLGNVPVKRTTASVARVVSLVFVVAGCRGDHGARRGAAQQRDADDAEAQHRASMDGVGDAYLGGQLELAAEAKLSQLVLLTLRERAALQTSDVPGNAALLPKVERRLHHLVVALCGDTVETTVGTLDVANAGPEQLFPLELVDRATYATCTGLVVDRVEVPGPLVRAMAAAKATAPAP